MPPSRLGSPWLWVSSGDAIPILLLDIGAIGLLFGWLLVLEEERDDQRGVMVFAVGAWTLEGGLLFGSGVG